MAGGGTQLGTQALLCQKGVHVLYLKQGSSHILRFDQFCGHPEAHEALVNFVQPPQHPLDPKTMNSTRRVKDSIRSFPSIRSTRFEHGIDEFEAFEKLPLVVKKACVHGAAKIASIVKGMLPQTETTICKDMVTPAMIMTMIVATMIILKVMTTTTTTTTTTMMMMIRRRRMLMLMHRGTTITIPTTTSNRLYSMQLVPLLLPNKANRWRQLSGRDANVKLAAESRTVLAAAPRRLQGIYTRNTFDFGEYSSSCCPNTLENQTEGAWKMQWNAKNAGTSLYSHSFSNTKFGAVRSHVGGRILDVLVRSLAMGQRVLR